MSFMAYKSHLNKSVKMFNKLKKELLKNDTVRLTTVLRCGTHLDESWNREYLLISIYMMVTCYFIQKTLKHYHLLLSSQDMTS